MDYEESITIKRETTMCKPAEEATMIETLIESVNSGGEGDSAGDSEQDGAGEASPSCEGAGAFADTLDGPSGQGVEGG